MVGGWVLVAKGGRAEPEPRHSSSEPPPTRAARPDSGPSKRAEDVGSLGDPWYTQALHTRVLLRRSYSVVWEAVLNAIAAEHCVSATLVKGRVLGTQAMGLIRLAHTCAHTGGRGGVTTVTGCDGFGHSASPLSPPPCMRHYGALYASLQRSKRPYPRRWGHLEQASLRRGWPIVANGMAPECPECCWSTAARTR